LCMCVLKANIVKSSTRVKTILPLEVFSLGQCFSTGKRRPIFGN
jgi:hypothetical protein